MTVAVIMAIILKDILAIPKAKKPIIQAKIGLPAMGKRELPTAIGPKTAINNIVASIKF